MNKKITVRFNANTRLKPKRIVWNDKIQNAYPLYVNVIYDGSNTDFKAEVNGEMVLVTEDLAQLENPSLKNSLAKYERFIYNVIKTEIDIKKDQFSFSGFGNRLKTYNSSVQEVIGLISVQSMFDLIEDYLHKGNYNFDSKEVFSKIIDIYDHLKKYNVFEWQYGDDETDFMYLLDIDNQSDTASTVVFRFITDMINQSLE